MENITCYLLDDEILANDRLERLLKLQSKIKVIGRKSCLVGAIKEIQKLKPDIVFLDVEMPRLSGFEVLKQLKAHGTQSKFIYVTGYDQSKFIYVTGYDQYAIKAIRNETFDFMMKPIDMDGLTNTLNRYRDKQNGFKIPEGWQLSDREKEVLQLVVKGKTSQQIADELFLSKHTIDVHRRNILEKSGCAGTSELIGMI